jgi:hypothetical protein
LVEDEDEGVCVCGWVNVWGRALLFLLLEGERERREEEEGERSLSKNAARLVRDVLCGAAL